MIKALLIDLDGTLADSLPLLYRVYCGFLSGYGFEGTEQEFASLNGLTLLEVMKALVKKYSLSEEPERLVEHYKGTLDHAYKQGLDIFPFAKSCLIYAREKGFRLALVTSAKKELAAAFLQQHGLTFDEVITPGEQDRGKPSPDIYLRALRTLQIAPEEALAVEDAAHGLTAARAANIRTVHFQNNWEDVYAIVRKLEAAHPDFHYHPIDTHFEVVARPGRPAEKNAEVERLWREKRRENPKLFNGKIFSFVSFDKVLSGEFVDYKDYLCGARPIVPISVTGVIHTKDAVLIGKRSAQVSVCPGLLETPPSGTIDPEAEEGGRINLLKQIRKELTEETDLPRDLPITPFALIEDKKGGTWEICFWIPLKERREVSSNEEYETLFWVEKKEIPAFLEREYENLIPFTRYLLATFIA